MRRSSVLPLAALVPLATLVACADPVSTAGRPGDASLMTWGRRTPATALPAGRYLIGLAPDAALDSDVLAAAGAQVTWENETLDLVEVDAEHPGLLRSAAGVRFLEPSFEFALEAEQGDGELPAAEEAPSDTPAPNAPSAAPWYANGVQWNMRSARADAVWPVTRRGLGARVCIVDSGIDDTHQELTGKVVADTSFVPGTSPAPLDSNGHGTHLAGTVTANGVVTAGFAPDASLMAAKVFAATGATSVTRVVNALQWCADNGAHVINMSLGGVTFYPPTPLTSEPSYSAFATAVQYATTRGAVVVVSAGNSNIRLNNPSVLITPAQVPGTIIVGATGPLSRVGVWTVGGAQRTLPLTPTSSPVSWNPFDPEQVWHGPDGKAFYSNWGEGVHVFAPGGRGGVPAGYVNRIVADESGTRQQQTGSALDNIAAACSRWSNYAAYSNNGGNPTPVAATCRAQNGNDRYAIIAGTSMAAPHVAGLAALLYGELDGVRSAENRALVERCIRTGTDDIGPSTTFGGGRINAEKALACVRG
jgi:subtilisin family serine protease